jgi:putative cell wall-binding protein
VTRFEDDGDGQAAVYEFPLWGVENEDGIWLQGSDVALDGDTMWATYADAPDGGLIEIQVHQRTIPGDFEPTDSVAITDTDCYSPSLAAHDGSGRMAFVAGGWLDAEVYYSEEGEAGWSAPVRVTVNDTGDRAPVVAISDEGEPGIAYLGWDEVDQIQVHYAEPSGSVWTTEKLTTQAGGVNSCDLTFYQGQPHIIYEAYDPIFDQNKVVHLWRNGGGAWMEEELEGPATTGEDSWGGAGVAAGGTGAGTERLGFTWVRWHAGAPFSSAMYHASDMVAPQVIPPNDSADDSPHVEVDEHGALRFLYSRWDTHWGEAHYTRQDGEGGWITEYVGGDPTAFAYDAHVAACAVVDGDYILKAFADGSTGPLTTYSYDGVDYGAPLALDQGTVWIADGALGAGGFSEIRVRKMGLPFVGGISGTVTDALGDPVEGAEVTVRDHGSDDLGDPVIVEALTGASGDYEVHGLGPGSYVVEFYDPVGGTPREFYDDKSSIILATEVVVPVGGTATDVDAMLGDVEEPPPPDDSPTPGDDRYGTSVGISEKAFPTGLETDPEGYKTVVIATGVNWPDALGGASLAGALGSPMLLTQPNDLPADVANEVVRLGADRAIIIGGAAAVAAGVEADLAALGITEVERIAGATRYQTANLVAARTVGILGDAYDGRALVATGRNFPDALAASPLAAAAGWPLFLSAPTTGLDADTQAAIDAADVTDAVILGGTGAVPTTVETQLTSLGITSERLAGASRYLTAIMIAEYGIAEAGLGWNGLAIATGRNFPDALAGGVLQGLDGSVILLTPGNTLDLDVADTLEDHRPEITLVRFLGGTAAVSQAVRDEVLAILE